MPRGRKSNSKTFPALSRLESGSLPEKREFRKAVRRTGVSIIAEIKRRSPSAGMIRADADAGGIAPFFRNPELPPYRY